jgi:hypothetical protein
MNSGVLNTEIKSIEKMKAKVKATGGIIEATMNANAQPTAGTGARYVYEGSDGNTYFDTELDFDKVFPDWQQVRIQAAIAAMNTLITCYEGTSDKEQKITKRAVQYADALVEELKKKGE